MSVPLTQQIDRAKELLSDVRHAAMATVNSDGSPHNTPFLFMHDDTLEHVLWGSHPESQHSLNVLRTGRIFVVLYEATQRGGLFIQCENGHPLTGTELEIALAIHTQLRHARNQDSLPIEYYSGKSPQRMWSARITGIWVNGSVRDATGHIVQDIRTKISAQDLVTLR